METHTAPNSFRLGGDLLLEMKLMIRARQLESMMSTSGPIAGTKFGLVSGSSSIFAVGLPRAWMKTPTGTRARLESSFETTTTKMLYSRMM